MATIRAYIRTQSKNKQSVKIRFLLTDKKVNLSYVSDMLINPLYWDNTRQGYNQSKQIPPTLRNETDSQIQKIRYLILSIYNTEFPKGELTSNRLTELVNQELYSANKKVKTEKSTRINRKKQVSIESKNEISLLDAIQFTLKHNNITYKRFQTYLVVRYSIEKFIYYNLQKNKKFTLTLENTNIDMLWELEKFFYKEFDLFALNPQINTIFPKYKKPSVRASNTVIGFMRIVRAVFNFCIKHEMTQNYPFKKYKMKEQVYGTPFYPTRDELRILYEFHFENKTFCEQRDIFIFQCQVGMRINDFYQLKRDSINNGILEYIPSKTKRFRAKTITIPLNPVALEILERYAENDKILPFISEQGYNQNLKKIFTHVGLTRPVTFLDPVTNEEVIKPLNEVIHSHAARKFFCAALFEQVRDQSIVAELSGHSPNSVVFERYRNISTELKKSLTDNIF